eukprot:7391351-Prymnesium_polylepis.2
MGLDTVAKAALAAHGQVWLSTESDEPCSIVSTTCHIHLPAEEVQASSTPHELEHVHVADDEPASSREFGQLRAPAELATASGCRVATELCTTSPSTEAPAAAGDAQPSMVAISIDDDPMMRLLHRTLFTHFLGSSSFRCLGADDDEIDGFVECALGMRSLQSLQRLGDDELQHQADVVILDQHIERPGEGGMVLGTELAAKLKERSFEGVTCILTASSAQLKVIGSLPGVDLAVEKGAPLTDLARRLQDALALKRQRTEGAHASRRMRVAAGAPGTETEPPDKFSGEVR